MKNYEVTICQENSEKEIVFNVRGESEEDIKEYIEKEYIPNNKGRALYMTNPKKNYFVKSVKQTTGRSNPAF